MFRVRVSVSLIVLLAVQAGVGAVAPPPGPLPSQIAAWIDQLGDDTFAAREEASVKLRAAGERAEAALEQALKSGDAEVVRRARAILSDFVWGIYPDTPPEIVKLIGAYRSASRLEKSPVITQLLRAGPQGSRALTKIVRAETDPLVRKEVFSMVAANLSKVAPSLVETGDLATLEAAVELALAGDVRTGMPAYAAFHLLRGTLPARIASWEERAGKAVVAKQEKEVLALLYRANDDLDRAIKAAADAERNDLIEAFLYEKADWKELARRPELQDTSNPARSLGTQAAYARLAGDRKAFAALVEQLQQRGKKPTEQLELLGGGSFAYAKALLLNGKTREALALMDGDTPVKTLYEIHAARLDYAAAFALVERLRTAGSPDLPLAEILQARTLHHLGQKDRAAKLLARHEGELEKLVRDLRGGERLSAPIVKARDGWVLELIDVENLSERRDRAFALVAEVLSVTGDGAWAKKAFEKLFGRSRAEEARLLWQLLRDQYPEEKEAARLARLRKFLEGKAGKEELQALYTQVRKQGVVGQGLRHIGEEAEMRRVLGEIALLCKQGDLAAEWFKAADSVRGLIRLGDLLADKKQWLPAAVQYEAAFRKGTGPEGVQRREEEEGEGLPALALYLAGHALVEAGRVEEGKRRMEQAHLLPMGDVEMRFDLSRALSQRGHREAAAREHDILRRTGEPVLQEANSYYSGEGLRGAAIVASRRKDWLRAADGFEQTFLRVLHPEMNFSRPQAYVQVPAFIGLTRARGLLAAGKLPEAIAEITRIREITPGNVDLAITLVPELDKKGHHREADALYQGVQAVYRDLLKRYPESAWMHNQSAWLSALCRRELENALEHARTAIKLAPDSAAFHDTLAEVLFQLGKRDEAIVAQKKAIELATDKEAFRKALQRIEAGDPRVPRSVEDD